MNPPLTSVPLAFQLILALIAASAVIGAAIITSRSKGPSRQSHRGRRICLHKNGAIFEIALRIVGPEGFEKTFKTGEIWLPILPHHAAFEVYVSGKWLGTIRNPTGSDEVLVINLEIKSECWEPA